MELADRGARRGPDEPPDRAAARGGRRPRFLPIFIGSPEATAIVYALQGVATPRPMTHDLFKTVLDDLGVKLDRVEITELHEGTFYAEIELDAARRRTRISCRPSDAIALARSAPASRSSPTKQVLDEAGVLRRRGPTTSEPRSSSTSSASSSTSQPRRLRPSSSRTRAEQLTSG